MIRFAIITPTIGRDTLRRCLITMRHVVLKAEFDYQQFVVGDGHQEPWVSKECGLHEKVRYMETPVKEGFYGTAPRNYVLEQLESFAWGVFDYVLFLDDDNLLLEPALYNLARIVQDFNHPPLIFQQILFTNKYRTDYRIMPAGGVPLVEDDWDSLNCIYRTDVIRGLRWKPVYNHDLLFGQEARKRAQGPWINCPGVNAVHCLSWDTYELEKKA